MIEAFMDFIAVQTVPSTTTNRRSFLFDLGKSILALGAGLYCLLLLAESNSRLLKMRWLYDSSIYAQFGWLVMGSALLAYGFAALPIFPSVKITQPKSRFTYHMLILLAILLLAFVLRAINLEQAVFMYVDEFGSAEAVVQLQKYERQRLLLPHSEVAGWSRVFAYTQRWSVELFGANLTGLRAVSVLVGTLSVAAMYLLAAPFFERLLALLAAFWLATFPPHIHFSRLGVPNIVDPLFGTLALAFLLQGYRNGRRRYFALAGVMLGLTQYFYEAGRLLYPVLILSFATVVLVWNWRQPDETKPLENHHLLKGLGVTGLAGLLVALPVYLTLAANERSIATRFNQMNTAQVYLASLSSDPAGWLRNTFAPPFLHLIAQPDSSGLYYGGQFGLILPWIVPLFLIGVGYALWHWRQPEMFMLIIWIAGVVIGNSLIQQNTYSSRYVVVLPALIIGIVLGVKFLLTRWERYRQVIFIATIVLASTQVFYYFGPHLALYNRQIRAYRDFAEIMPRSRNFHSGTQLHLITDDGVSLYQIGVLRDYFHINLKVDVVAPENLSDTYLDNLNRKVDHAFYVLPEDRTAIEQIQRHFLTGAPRPSPNNIPADRQYWLVYAPAPRGK